MFKTNIVIQKVFLAASVQQLGKTDHMGGNFPESYMGVRRESFGKISCKWEF